MELLKKPKVIVSVLSRKNIEENINLFLEYFYETEMISPDATKAKYISALNKLQNNSIPIVNGRSIVIVENSNNDLHKYLLSTNTISAENLTTSKDSVTIERNIVNALNLIKSLNKGLYSLIEKLVGTIIFSKNGSFSSATAHTHLGIIFLNPSDGWDVKDYAEAIYHEFIHLSIFLEDMIHTLFNQELIDKDDPHIKSVLRGVKRPLDKSFHAAIVAIGIMHFYHMVKNTEKSMEYMKDLREVVRGLDKMDKYFSEKGRELLYNVNLFLKIQDFQSITHSLEN